MTRYTRNVACTGPRSRVGSRGRSRGASRKGAIIVLTALLLIVMLAMISFAIDVGCMTLVRTELQVAADAAATAGAAALVGGPASAKTAAQTFGSANKAAGTSVSIIAQDIVLGTWESKTLTFTPAADADAELNDDSVKVTCICAASRGNAAKFYFANIFGKSTFDQRAVAIAQLRRKRCSRIVGIDYVTIQGGKTDSYDSSKGSYASQAPKQEGHVCSNGDITVNSNGTINGNATPGPGNRVIFSGGTVTGSTDSATADAKYPPTSVGTAATINDNGLLPNGTISGSGNLKLSGGNTLTMPPGTYYVKGDLTVTGSAAINVTGPTVIYVMGTFDVGGGGIANLTMLPKNLTIYAMNDTAVKYSGSTSLYVNLYAPSTPITFTGTSDIYGTVIGKSLSVSGGGSIHYDEALDIDYENKPAAGVLVQ